MTLVAVWLVSANSRNSENSGSCLLLYALIDITGYSSLSKRYGLYLLKLLC